MKAQVIELEDEIKKEQTAEKEEVKEDQPQQEAKETAKPEETKAEEKTAQPDECESLRKEAEHWKDQYYRTLAETTNVKRRLENEAIQSKKYQIQGFALNILPVLDNLDRALDSKTTDENLHKGVQMVRDQLWNALQSEGITEIEALDKPFDANYHHAIMMEKAEGKASGMVIEVYQKGYMLKDRLLRAAMVKVSE